MSRSLVTTHLDSYLSATEREKLSSTLIRLNPIPADKELLAQGQQTTNFFVIAKGTADVYLHGVRVRSLVAGSVCGELAAASGDLRLDQTVRWLGSFGYGCFFQTRSGCVVPVSGACWKETFGPPAGGGNALCAVGAPLSLLWKLSDECARCSAEQLAALRGGVARGGVCVCVFRTNSGSPGTEPMLSTSSSDIETHAPGVGGCAKRGLSNFSLSNLKRKQRLFRRVKRRVILSIGLSAVAWFGTRVFSRWESRRR